MGIQTEIIIHFIQSEWITPADRDTQVLDDEDLARLKLILQLRKDMGVNDDAIPIILSLLDQIHYLHSKLLA